MASKLVLKIRSGEDEEIEFSVTDKSVLVCNTASDATSFSFVMSSEDWDEVKTFIDQQMDNK